MQQKKPKENGKQYDLKTTLHNQKWAGDITDLWTNDGYSGFRRVTNGGFQAQTTQGSDSPFGSWQPVWFTRLPAITATTPVAGQHER